MRRLLICGLGLAAICGAICGAAHADTDWTWSKTAFRPASKGVLPFTVPQTETGPWLGTRLEESSRLELPLAEGSLYVLLDRGKMSLDLDEDRKGDEGVSSGVKPMPFTFRIGEGNPVPYVMAFVGERNALAGENWYYYRTGCYREAKVGKRTRLVLIDGNADGRFDGFGEDFCVVGRGKIATYLSRVIHVDGELMELKVEADGTRVAVKPYSGSKGTLDLRKGYQNLGRGQLSAAVVKGDGMSFDGSTAVEVPAGRYTLTWGMVKAGRQSCQFKCELDVRVDPGQVGQVAFGGKVKVLTQFNVDEDKLEVVPGGLSLVGSADEHYFNFDPPLRPKVHVREKSSRKLLTRGSFSKG